MFFWRKKTRSTCKQVGKGKDVRMACWESDLLIVLRAEESSVHGEAADEAEQVRARSVRKAHRGKDEDEREAVTYSDTG
jgi:hypothetical protein